MRSDWEEDKKMLWKNGETELDVSCYLPELSFLIETAIEGCIDHSYAEMTPGALILPLFSVTETSAVYTALSEEVKTNWTKMQRILRHCLKSGINMGLCRQVLETGIRQTKEEFNPYERNYWKAEAAELMEELPESAGLKEMVLLIFQAARKEEDLESELLEDLLDFGKLWERMESDQEVLSLFDEQGKLQEDLLSASAKILIRHTRKTAAQNACEEALPIHLLYGMLREKDGYLWQTARRVTPPLTALSEDCVRLQAMIADRSEAEISGEAKQESDLHSSLKEILTKAGEGACLIGEKLVDDRQILLQLLQSRDAGTQSILRDFLQWPVEDMIKTAERTKWEPLFLRLPVELCDCRNLSLEGGILHYAERPEVVSDIIRILYRKDCHNVALWGERGVGKTTSAWLLAKELKIGKAELFQIVPVIYMDIYSIPDEELENRISPIFTYMEDHPRAIYVLDGFGLMLAALPKVCLRRAAKSKYYLIALLDRDAKILLDEQTGAVPVFQSLELEEPKKDLLKEMIKARIPEIEREFEVLFEENLENFTLRVAGDYILSRRFPQKAVALLESAAADAAAEAALSGGDTPLIGRRHLAAQIANETGLPVETILGTGQDKDYTYLLSRNLVGQDHAVAKVANRLDLIQKGFVDKSRPAAIFMFAGLSGTGKTELAKQIASVYSSSHKIITYTMADFKDASSVSRFIGSAPGLVGYDEGGRLINDINKDPYSLILFDEVEKAHPATWDPLLNLFDEGVITDTKGTIAYANKSFFVMTSNIGQYEIVRMLREKRPLDEIEKTVQEAIGEATYARTGEKCFRPEFIGRIIRSGGIVIFNALSLEAMEGITRHLANKEAARFAEMRESRLEIDDEVIATIARRAFEENDIVLQQQTGLYLGGRRINTLFDEMVLNRLAENARQMSGAVLVRIIMDGSRSVLVPITDESEAEELLGRRRETTIARIMERLDRLALTETQNIQKLTNERLARLDAILAEAGIMSGV